MPKRVKNSKKASNKFAVHVILEPKPDTPFYYVNYMSCGHAEFDFTLAAIRLPSYFSPEQAASIKKGEPLTFEPTLQLVVPPRVIRGLIDALTEQVKKYEEQFGPIRNQGHKNE